MPVRVLWAIKGLGPGGAERLLVALAGAHDPDVASFECAYVLPYKRHLVPDLEQRGVPCHCLSTKDRDLRWVWRLTRLVRSGRFDVVHVHSPLPGSVARLAAATTPKRRRPAIVTTEHNAWNTFRLPTRWLNRWTGRLDRYTFAVSGEVAASLRGPAVARSEVLIHGIDLAAVRATAVRRDEIRASLGLSADEPVVATVANFRDQKDHPTLLRAAARLAARGVPFTLLVVGQGPKEADVRRLHAELGLGDHVQLLGYRADAVDVLAAADVFVLASKWEGLPVALMEATALGLPCVLTRVGGMPDALGDDGAEWVEPGDPRALAAALERVLAEPARRARLADQAAAAARQFDVRRAAKVIEARYAPPVPKWAPPVGLENLTIRRATERDEPAAIELCRQVLGPHTPDEWPALFRWKHHDNPFGASPIWVAADGDRIVAVRVLMHWEFRRDGRTIRAVRAVDTATHPDYQGKGLFTALTLQGLAEVQADGVRMVFNTPNDKSRPGYLKMGWKIVDRFRPVVALRSPFVARRVARSRVPAALFPEPLAVGTSVGEWITGGGLDRYPAPAVPGRLATPLDAAFVRWRFGSDLQPCRVVDDGRAAVVVERRRRGEVVELVCLLRLGDAAAADRLLRRTMREARCDVALRLGSPRPASGFFPLPGTGPLLTCRMLAPEPIPRPEDWGLALGDVVLF